MHSIIIEPPTIVEPIDQTSPQFDLAGWFFAQFPDVIVPSTRSAEPSQIPIIEW
jgi:hypothetical protein